MWGGPMCPPLFVRPRARESANLRSNQLPESAMKPVRVLILLAALAVAFGAQSIAGLVAQSSASPSTVPGGGPFDTLHFRPIGPASMSGRIADVAVYEPNPSVYYVGTAHGGVWKT